MQESLIIKRLDKTKAENADRDWCIEVRWENSEKVKTQTYYLDKGKGLIRTEVNGVFGDLPNVAGIDFSTIFVKQADGSEFSMGISDSRYDIADRVEYNLRASRIVDYVEKTLLTAKFSIGSGKVLF